MSYTLNYIASGRPKQFRLMNDVSVETFHTSDVLDIAICKSPADHSALHKDGGNMVDIM